MNIIVGELPEGASGHEWSRYTVKYRVPPEMVHTREAVEKIVEEAIEAEFHRRPDGPNWCRDYAKAVVSALLAPLPAAPRTTNELMAEWFEGWGEVAGTCNPTRSIELSDKARAIAARLREGK